MSPVITVKKPILSLSQIINMSVGFLGIQFGFGLQNANVSRIFQSLGAKIDDIPILWIAAPLTGLIMQPVIGHLSDKTWSPRWGRRRPFFLIGAILASLALIFFPNVYALWMAAIMLWLLDASINISMEPFRAFVGDMLPDEQRTAGFAMQSFFIGIGAVVSSVLPYLLTKMGVANEAAPGVIPNSVKISFYIGAAVFFLSVVYTVFTTKEYSPAELKSFESAEQQEVDHSIITTSVKSFYNKGFIWLITGAILSFLLYYYNVQHVEMPLEKELYVLTFGIASFGLIQLAAGFSWSNNSKNGLVEVVNDLYKMPDTMKQLAVVQFFTWFALFAMWIYATPGLAQNIANTTDTSSKAYNEIGNWVGVLFGFYNGFSAFFAFLLPVLAKKTSRPMTHLICLVAGGLGLISFFIFKDKYLLILSMAGIGLAWSSILSMPYSMLTAALPSNKMGVYMGIFNFFIVIPQILAATLLGFFTKHLFNGNAIYTLVLGGALMIVAALLTLRIKIK
ncbi:MAG: transporter [Ferruginibacter sp.]|uniref:MFS transporter n=1 Tax=Ferruginibacter sp. TaxID=1940288 RepID=UPI00265AB714|nr:MFS transporter [Ferruginibacter sp.]MDB5277046.1 transporter [Ferruginibacter sp.]